MTTLANRALLVLLLFCSCCSSVQGHTGNEYRTSAYSMEACQQKLDQMAGGQHVTMTDHVSQPGVSALNFGLVPAVICHGRTERRLPHMDEVVGPTLTDQSVKAIIVFVPGQDAKPYGITCARSNFFDTTKLCRNGQCAPPWPEGPAIYQKYCLEKH